MLARRGFQSTTRAAVATTGAVRHLTTRGDRRVGAAPMERRPVHEGDTEQPHQSMTAARKAVGATQPLQQFSFEDYEARRSGASANAAAAAAATSVHQRRLLATLAPPPPLAPLRGLGGSRFNTGSLLMSQQAIAAAERNRANQMNPMHAQYWMSRGFDAAEAARRAQMAGVGASAYMGARQPARLGPLFAGQAVARPIQVIQSVPAKLRAINALRRRRILRRAFAPPVATGADYRPGVAKRMVTGTKKFAVAKPIQRVSAKPLKTTGLQGAKMKKKPASAFKSTTAASKLATRAATKSTKKSGSKKAQLKLHKKAELKRPTTKPSKMASKGNKLKGKSDVKANIEKSGNTVASALASVVAKRQKKLLQAPAPQLHKAMPKTRAGRQAAKAPRSSRLDLKDALAHSTLRARRDPAHPAYWLQQGYELPEATEAAAKYTGRPGRAPAMMKKPSSAATKNRRAAGALREALDDQQWLLNTIY